MSEKFLGDAVSQIDISIPKETAIKFITGGDAFFEAYPLVVNLVVKEMNRLAKEAKAKGEDAMLIERLKEEGLMYPSVASVSDCLKCLNGKMLREDESCSHCNRFCDNYGELFPMR